MLFALGPFLILTVGLAMALHEGGHWLCARVIGCRVLSVVVGAGPRLARFRVGTTDVTVRAAPIRGHTRYRWRQVDTRSVDLTAVTAAGPAVNVVAGALALALVPRWGAFALIAVGANGMMAVANLVPGRRRCRHGRSDGAVLLSLWRSCRAQGRDLAGWNDRLAPRERAILESAAVVARNSAHATVTADHILVGILQNQRGLGGRILRGHGLTSAAVRRAGGLNLADAATGPVPHRLDPKAVSTLRRSLILAGREGAPFLRSEHLVLAMLDDPCCGLVGALRRVGLSTEPVREGITTQRQYARRAATALDDMRARRYASAREGLLATLHWRELGKGERAMMQTNLAWADLMIGADHLRGEAVRMAADAFARGPDVPAIMGTQSLALIESGKIQGGLELSTRVLGRTTDLNPSAQANQLGIHAIGLLRLGGVDEARRYLSAAIAVDPRSDLVARAQAELAQAGGPIIVESLPRRQPRYVMRRHPGLTAMCRGAYRRMQARL